MFVPSRFSLLVAISAAAAGSLPGQNSWSTKLGSEDRIVHAVRRLTFGPAPGEIERVRATGLNKWLDAQLHPEKIKENPVLAQKLEPLRTLRLSPAEMAEQFPPKAAAGVSTRRVVAQQLAAAKIYRAVYSNRGLEEVLVDFWYNHFNVFLDKGADRYLVTAYERDVIRPHVLGKFKDLLLATAESPAMLFYLDNWQSAAPGAATRRGSRGLNENYGRELLELHTLGVSGGYTQRDVVEVARCFTGWTIRAPRQGGGFYFNERMHDPGEKHVVGVRIAPGGGVSDGRKVIEILSRNPATARFISRELATRFVADDPSPRLVESMAKTFLKTDGDLRAVMRTMVRSREFFSEAAYGAKIRSPLEAVAGSVRALGAEIDSAEALAQAVARMGEPLYRKQEPTGYANTNEDWINTASVVARMNFAMALAEYRIPGVRADLARFENKSPEEVSAALLPVAPAEQTLTSIRKAAKDGKTAAGLVLGSPEFQRR